MSVVNKILISFLLLTACTRKTPQQRLVDFIDNPKNKITQTIEVGKTVVRSKYYPLSLSKFNSELQEGNQHLIFFNVRFDRSLTEEVPKEKILYLNFDMQHDFTLQLDEKVIAPVFCQRIENGRKGSFEYMLAFEDGKEIQRNEDFTLLYTDKIFGIGAISFVYNHKDIARVPES